jgi:hypothetical protein
MPVIQFWALREFCSLLVITATTNGSDDLLLKTPTFTHVIVTVTRLFNLDFTRLFYSLLVTTTNKICLYWDSLH